MNSAKKTSGAKTKRGGGASASPQSRWRRVYAKIWNEPRFRGISKAGRELALYLLAGPQTNRIGYFVFSPALAAETLGDGTESVVETLRAVCAAFGWQFDPQARVLWMPDWWANNPLEHSNHLIGNLKDLVELPESVLFGAFARNLADLQPSVHQAFRDAIAKATGKPYPDGSTDGSPDGSLHGSGGRFLEPSTIHAEYRKAGKQDAGKRERENAALASEAFSLYADAWQTKYGRQADEPTAAQRDGLLTLTLEHGTEGVRDALSAYFSAFTDEYAADARHPLGLFIKQFNRWAVDADGSPRSGHHEVLQ